MRAGLASSLGRHRVAALSNLARGPVLISGYFVEQATRPETIGYALLDSPVAMAAWMVDHDIDAYYKIAQAFVDGKPGQAPTPVPIPVGFTTFPGEIWRTPRSWVEKAYPNVVYFNEVDRGGHFAAWEEPELFAAEMRAAFRPVR